MSLRARQFFFMVAFCVAATVLPSAVRAGGLAEAIGEESRPRPGGVCEVCVEGCTGVDTCYTLVLRYTVNVAPLGQPVQLVQEETFTGENYEGIEAAKCGARKVRREGYVLPTQQYPAAESNVMPDTITPMPVI